MTKYLLVLFVLITSVSAQTFGGGTTFKGSVTVTPTGIPPLQPDSTLAIQSGNNSTDCSATGVPIYCLATPYQTWTDITNTGIQTVNYNPLGGTISPRTIQQDYLYAGATTTVICPFQPWWSTAGPGFNSHPYIGMSENSSTVINAQHNMMLALGCNVDSPDWYGLSSGQTYNQNTVIAEAADLAARSAQGYPLKFMIMFDKGALSPYCPTGSSDQTSCIVTAIELHTDYMRDHWAFQPYYLTRPSNGHPIMTTFLSEGDWSGSNWTTIWSSVKAHMTVGNGYSKPFDIVKEFGNFTEANIDGAYGWPQPLRYCSTITAWSSSTTYNANDCVSIGGNSYYSIAGGNLNHTPPNASFWTGQAACTTNGCRQFCDDSITCSTSYTASLYSQAQANPSQIVFGILYKGFNDTIGYGAATNRVTAAMCGGTLLDMKNAITANGYGTGLQLPYVQIGPWNDYEEGTAIETGVDNCFRVASVSMSGSVVNWTVSKTDATYANSATIHHYRIWFGSGSGTLYLAQDNISSGATSFDLAGAAKKPTTGATWNVYVQQIPLADMLSQISNGAGGNAGPASYTP